MKSAKPMSRLIQPIKRAYRRNKLVSLSVLLVVITTISGGMYFTQAANGASEPQLQKTKQVQITPAKVEKPDSLDDFGAIIEASKASVVKIEGEACDFIYDGSGFVVGTDLVATNAHVVAGVTSPYVIDNAGKHKGKVILFDPNLDFALLRVPGLAGKPLDLDVPKSGLALQGSHNDDHAVMLGYPGGGSFKTDLTTIVGETAADMYDIYGHELSTRDLFDLSINVEPGSSGSPIIQYDGRVTGIVFGVDPEDSKGLALPTHMFYDMIEESKGLQQPVDTQQCTISND